MSKIGVVILVRLSSSRLPRKALMEINGKKVIEIIFERVSAVFPNEDIIIATSTNTEDDELEKFCLEKSIKCFRGSLDDVSGRFYNAAKSLGLDYAIRINGDNVFIDIDVLKHLKQIALSNEYDFISNVDKRTFPPGMSIEILKMDYYLGMLPIIQRDDYYKEHVTKYLYDNDTDINKFYYYNTHIPEASEMRLALDTKEDFDLINSIFQRFENNHLEYGLRDIYDIWKKVKYEL